MKKENEFRDKTAVKTAFITGILGIIGTIAAAIISGALSKVVLVNQIISQVKTDTINIEGISDLVDNYNRLSSESLELKEENYKLDSDNVKLKEENDYLWSENKSLFEENDLLKESLQQSAILEEENNSMKDQIEQLKHELQVSQDNSDGQENNDIDERNLSVADNLGESDEGVSSTDSSGQKTSIFDLDVFKEKVPSYGYSEINLGIDDIDNNIDTFGRKYSTGRLCFHSTRPTEEMIPTYVLNQEYKICEGQIAWLKRYKNRSGTVWIEFYEGDSLIYQTEPIEALNGEKSFEFSVEGCDELTVVAKASSTNIYMIYPYFNLVK